MALREGEFARRSSLRVLGYSRQCLSAFLLGIFTVVSILSFVACSGGNPIEPTPDVDNDGILGAADRCPNEAETLNRIFDTDGCPDRPADLYAAVLPDVQAFWNIYFTSVLGRPYVPTRMQLFSGQTFSACGPGQGPFYCGIDSTVYLDERFMDAQLARFGDFAPAMILAHEVGHHTQNLLGLLGAISIQKELQADCLAGAWSASAGARGLLDVGDFQEAASSLFSSGDTMGTPWFAPGAHGAPFQRQQAYLSGFQRGAFYCA